MCAGISEEWKMIFFYKNSLSNIVPKFNLDYILRGYFWNRNFAKINFMFSFSSDLFYALSVNTPDNGGLSKGKKIIELNCSEHKKASA